MQCLLFTGQVYPLLQLSCWGLIRGSSATFPGNNGLKNSTNHYHHHHQQQKQQNKITVTTKSSSAGANFSVTKQKHISMKCWYVLSTSVLSSNWKTKHSTSMHMTVIAFPDGMPLIRDFCQKLVLLSLQA